MNRRVNAALLVACLLSSGLSPAVAFQAPFRAGNLDSTTIANNALSVARSTNTTGRCYAAVCRALRPIGVDLHGAAAYEARDLLLQDHRFVPLIVHSVDELQPGDIIVYDRSHSHPYGHISVYEGGYEEASDHLSPITHTQAYGSATVFRLRNELVASAPPAGQWSRPNLPSQASPYSSGDTYTSNAYAPAHSHSRDTADYPATQRTADPYIEERRQPPAYSDNSRVKSALSVIRGSYRLIAGEPIERTVARHCARFLMQGY